MPDNWHLVARDAFNGILLWKIPVKAWGWREWKDSFHASRGENTPVNINRRVVAAGDKLYVTLGYRAPVSEIDAATGEVLKTFKGTGGARELLFHNGHLVLTIPGQDNLKLMVLDPSTEQVVWQTPALYGGTDRESSKLAILHQSVLNAAVDHDAVCFIDRNKIVCLDRKSGAPRWTNEILPVTNLPKVKKRSTQDNALWAGALMIELRLLKLPKKFFV